MYTHLLFYIPLVLSVNDSYFDRPSVTFNKTKINLLLFLLTLGRVFKRLWLRPYRFPSNLDESRQVSPPNRHLLSRNSDDLEDEIAE